MSGKRGPKRNGPYVALSATFPDDDDIIAVGEKAAWLYVVMICDCRARRTDGVLTVERIARLHVQGWAPRLDALTRQGLVVREGNSVRIPAYLKWNHGESDYQRIADQRRRAACERWHPQPCATCQEPPEPVPIARVK